MSPDSTSSLRLYSEAQCVGSRPELLPIVGERVSVIARTQDPDGSWVYSVATRAKCSSVFRCFENELIPLPPIPLVSDDEHLKNIVEQTAELRYSIECQRLRGLLQERGLDPMKCLQISCGQGDDVNIELVLPDGSLISADFRWDAHERQAKSIVEWIVIQGRDDREVELCRQITSAADNSEFDARVRAFAGKQREEGL